MHIRFISLGHSDLDETCFLYVLFFFYYCLLGLEPHVGMSEVAFYAYHSKDACYATGQTLIFDTVTVNRGNVEMSLVSQKMLDFSVRTLKDTGKSQTSLTSLKGLFYQPKAVLTYYFYISHRWM